MENPEEHTEGLRSDKTDGQQQDDAPDRYRSRVDKGKLKMSTAMYKVGATVYVTTRRSPEGPYTVKKQNSDGTYELADAAGKVKHNVKESDIDD